MDSLQIFGVQFILSLIVFSLIAKWHFAPFLSDKPLATALGLLIIPHAFRHIGLTFLTPAVVSPEIPVYFATTAGYGDFLSGALAILALVALRWRLGIAFLLVWVFNIVGTIDLLHALPQSGAVPYFGAAWFIPTFLVPLLLVTHVMIFARLLKTEHQQAH